MQQESNIYYNFQLSVGGFSDKQNIFLDKIMNKLTSFKVDSKRFDIYKETVCRVILLYIYLFIISSLVYQVVEEFCCRATLSSRSLLSSSATNWTFMDQTGAISSHWSYVKYLFIHFITIHRMSWCSSIFIWVLIFLYELSPGTSLSYLNKFYRY